MKTYICNKLIHAVPIKMVNGCFWPDDLPLPEITEPKQVSEHCGFTCDVLIEEGYMFTTSADDKYPQFMTAAEFEKTCSSTEDMNFGDALVVLKQGKRVARKGWNGKGMFLYHVPAAAYPPSTEVAKAAFHGENVPYGAYIAMKTAQGNVVPWLASQTDMLAEDWYIVE